MSRGLSRAFDIVSSLAVVCLAAIALWTYLPSKILSSDSSPSLDVIAVDGLDVDMGRRVIGQTTAPIGIVEFSDFECPFCRRYAKDIYPVIRKQWIETGVAIYGFRHFPIESLHPEAVRAAIVAECAGEQNKFWEMRAYLFEPQKQFMPGLKTNAPLLDDIALAECVARNDEAAIRVDQQDGVTLGLNATPSLVLGVLGSNGRLKAYRVIRGIGSIDSINAEIKAINEMALRRDQL
jgi:protein-disulfide isomerase